MAEPAPPAKWSKLPWLWLFVPLLVVAGLAALLLAQRSRRFSAELRFDPAGHPELHVTCATCPAGSTLTLGPETATVTGGRGVLRLTPPVSLGRQQAAIEIRAPGQSGSRTEQLEYEIDHIVSPDQRGLAQPEPKLALIFDAKPDVSFVVDGRVVAATASGTRRYEIPVLTELTGPAKAPVTLTRKVQYLVKRRTGESLRGEIEFRVEVVALSVEAPGESIVIEGASFVLAGATERDGLVSVEARPITVDPTGRFAQLMSVSAIGDTTVSVRASAPGRAPRIVPIRVKRVASLAAAAAEFERRAEGSFAAITDNLEQKRGWAVALEGKLSDVQSDGYVSSLLVEVTRGCRAPPCRARLRLGERTQLKAGQLLAAYGYLAGNSADPATGRVIPEVRVEFLRGLP